VGWGENYLSASSMLGLTRVGWQLAIIEGKVVFGCSHSLGV